LVVRSANGVGSRFRATTNDLDLPYFDVTGSGHIALQDVLAVINYINRGGSSGDGGEGESVAGSVDISGFGWLLTVERFVSPGSDAQRIMPVSQPVDDAAAAAPANGLAAATAGLDDLPHVSLRQASDEDAWSERKLELPDWEDLLDDRPADYAALDAFFAAWDNLPSGEIGNPPAWLSAEMG
jgi:hypothetical protein